MASQVIGILLVSDRLLTRSALGHLLTSLGFAVVGEAATHDEALSLARASRPDVTLLDLDSALDASAFIENARSAAGAARVIVLSDRTRAAEHSQLVELGAVGLVLKNDPPEILAKAISKVHAGELWLDRASTARLVNQMSRRRQLEDVEGAKIEALTRREHEIIALIGEGLKNAEIAQRLFISEATVRNHLTSIFDKLDLSDRFELAVYAFRHGLVQPPQHVAPRRATSE